MIFLGYSIGSLTETQSHLCDAFDRRYLRQAVFDRLFGEGTEIRRMIVAFIRSMVMPGSGVKNIRKIPNFRKGVWELYERLTGQQRPEFFRREGTSVLSTE